MSEQSDRLRISGLTRLEFLEIKTKLGAAVNEEIDTEHSSEEHLDLGMTAAIVIVSALAIKAITVIFSRRTKERKRTIEIEKITPEGTTRVVINESIFEAEDPEPELIDQLGKAFAIDTFDLLGGNKEEEV